MKECITKHHSCYEYSNSEFKFLHSYSCGIVCTTRQREFYKRHFTINTYKREHKNMNVYQCPEDVEDKSSGLD